MLGLDCARFYSFRGARANLGQPGKKPGKKLEKTSDHLRRERGVPGSTRNISRDTAQKIESNAPDFNDAS
jgi:hypothetical protein